MVATMVFSPGRGMGLDRGVDHHHERLADYCPGGYSGGSY